MHLPHSLSMEGKENVSLQNPEGPTVQCLLYRLFFIRIPYFYKIYNIFLAKRFYKQDMGRLSFRLIGKQMLKPVGFFHILTLRPSWAWQGTCPVFAASSQFQPTGPKEPDSAKCVAKHRTSTHSTHLGTDERFISTRFVEPCPIPYRGVVSHHPLQKSLKTTLCKSGVRFCDVISTRRLLHGA